MSFLYRLIIDRDLIAETLDKEQNNVELLFILKIFFLNKKKVYTLNFKIVTCKI